MREILFRGKTIATNKWIQGGYYSAGSRTFIVAEVEFETNWNIDTQIYKGYRMYEVHPSSVGQYIDDTDHNGTKIFEGDIVREYGNDEDGYAQVFWEDQSSQFSIIWPGLLSDFDSFYGHELEVIGNIYDDPELLERSCM